MTISLISNALLLLSLCAFHWFVIIKWPHGERAGQIASGLLFGAAAIAAMHWSVNYKPGIIFDARTVVLSLAGLFGGPLTAGIAGISASIYRIYLGGGGYPVGVATILASILIGLLFKDMLASALPNIRVLTLFVFGLIVQLVSIGLFSFLSVSYVDDILLTLATPFLVTLTLCTVVMGVFLREIEKSRFTDQLIEESEQRFESLFDSAAVALLEEDLSVVVRKLDELRASGVTDLQAHLDANPGLVSELINAVKITKANKYATDLFMAPSAVALIGSIEKYFGPGAREIFVERLHAYWDGVSMFVRSAEFRRSDGVSLNCIISMPIPKTVEAAKRVPVSVTDITDLKNTERVLADERRKLEEIIWGTGTGTWEWNLETGATVFNERWAEIVGYSLKELEPVTLKTWESLLHPDDAKAVETALDDVISNKHEYYESTHRLRHKNGSWVWVLDRGHVLAWADDGKPLRMSGTHTDVTSLKKAEIQAQKHVQYSVALSQFQGEILLGYTHDQLMQKLAEILSKSMDSNLIWIGVPDGVQVLPIAKAGKQVAFLETVSVCLDVAEQDQVPCALAVMRKQVYVVNDLYADPCCIQWQQSMINYNLRSVASIPVLFDN